MHWYIASLIFVKGTVILMQLDHTALWLNRGYGLMKLLHSYNMHNSQRMCCANSNMFDHAYNYYVHIMIHFVKRKAYLYILLVIMTTFSV